MRPQQSALRVLPRHTRSRLTVDATLGQTMPPATEFSPGIPFVPDQDESIKCCLGHGDAKDCNLYTLNSTKALIIFSHRGHQEQWELVLAASSGSARAKSQHAETLV